MEKYIPNGYQIINLGDIDLTTTVTLNDDNSKMLIELFKSNRLYSKPFLIHLHETNDDIDITGFAQTYDTYIIMKYISDDISEIRTITISVTDETVTVYQVIKLLE